jgi:hypothetical protein
MKNMKVKIENGAEGRQETFTRIARIGAKATATTWNSRGIDQSLVTSSPTNQMNGALRQRRPT